jgi:hypothetical protein
MDPTVTTPDHQLADSRPTPPAWRSWRVVLPIVCLVLLVVIGLTWQNYGSSRPLTPEDRAQIADLVKQLTDEPVLRIRPDDPFQVEVMTGEIRGPLDGGGRIFWFRKSWGRWKRIREDGIAVWVS